MTAILVELITNTPLTKLLPVGPLRDNESKRCALLENIFMNAESRNDNL
jgi:hypothetical protein